MKTIIERGASWTLEETKLLLALWGQDLVARQATSLKRTKEVYEKISEKFNKEGFERTPDQVRTRVFNMIAEYRRILKDPNPERMKKCIFFDALHKIYQARHMSDVKSAIDDYEMFNPYSPGSNSKSLEMEDASNDGASHGADETSVMETSNTTAVNNVSNNNNTNSTTTSKAAISTDTTKSSGSTTAATTNSTSGSGSGNNNKTSATSDNVSNSINDGNSAKKTPSSKDGQALAKRPRIDSPKAGTSHGDTLSQDDSLANASGDAKQTNKVSANNIAGSLSSNIQNASSTFTNNTASSSGANKQQSLLASATSSSSSSSSSATTPINKFNNQGGNATSFININSAKLPIIRSQILGHSNGNDSININGTPQPRLPTTAAITSHQLYQAPVNTFDVTSSALLIDRMFAHLSKESENMREWIALEKERIALERARRSQETEREVRRERVLIDTLMKFQEQWISFVTRLDPRVLEGAAGPLPELNIPKDLLDSQNDRRGSPDVTPKLNQSSCQTYSANKPGTSSSGASPVPANPSLTTSVRTYATTTTTTTAATSGAAAVTVQPARKESGHATY